MVPGMNGVQIGPGATAFTRMPLPVSAFANDREKARFAPFVVEYPTRESLPLKALTLVVFTIVAPSFRWGSAA